MYNIHINSNNEKNVISFYFLKKDVILQLEKFMEKQKNNNPKILSMMILKDFDNNHHNYGLIRIYSKDSSFVEVFRFDLLEANEKMKNNNFIFKDDCGHNLDSLFLKNKLDLSNVLENLNLMNNNDILSINIDLGFFQIGVIGQRFSLVRIPKGRKFNKSEAESDVLKNIEDEYYYYFCSTCDSFL